jgi:hypothetical protein
VAARLREAGVVVALDLEPTAGRPDQPVTDGAAHLGDDGALRWRYRGRDGSGVEGLLALNREDAR